MTSTAEYLGGLRVKNTHLKSQSTYITDAPTDNHGKGESFSPSDTVATALANCLLTVMGIKAEQSGINLKGAKAEITKTMAANPRRIAKIEVEVYFPENYEEKTKKILEHTALHCPVHQSLHPDTEMPIHFHYPEA